MWTWERPEISIVHGQDDRLDNPWAANSVFGRQGPEVHKIAWSDFGPQSDPQGEAQDAPSQIFSPRPNL